MDTMNVDDETIVVTDTSNTDTDAANDDEDTDEDEDEDTLDISAILSLVPTVEADIRTTIAGVNFNTCIFNASGCWCTTGEELNNLIESSAGAVVSKSGTVDPRDGNPEPRLFTKDPYGSINSMGVPNNGFEFYTKFGNEVNTKPFIQSIIPFSQDDLELMLVKMDSLITNGPRLVEVNLSCPNIVNKSVVAYHSSQ